MYADRSAKPTLKPGSLGVALAINGAVIAALVYSAPGVFTPKPDDFKIIEVFTAPPPKPEPLPKPKIEPHDARPSLEPKPAVIDHPIVETQPTGPVFDPHPPFDPGPTGNGIGNGTGTTIDPPKPAVILGPQLDGRYADNFQPAYPAEERRAGNSGRVVVRVLVGTDGRVKQVERVSAPSDSFFAATMRRAFDKWRFRPGTRDGVAVEAWYTVGVSFVLND